MKNLPVTIKKLREQAGLSPTELAERSELSAAYISKLEKGQYQTLTLMTLKSLSIGLGLSMKDLLSELGLLGNQQTKPSLQIVAQALRGNGYTNTEVADIVAYARYKKQQRN